MTAPGLEARRERQKRLFDQLNRTKRIRIQITLVTLMTGSVDGTHEVFTAAVAIVVDVARGKAHDLTGGQSYTGGLLLTHDITVVLAVNLYLNLPNVTSALGIDRRINMAADHRRIATIVNHVQCMANVVSERIVALIVLTAALILVDKNLNRVLLPILARGVDNIIRNIQQQVEMLCCPNCLVFAGEIRRAARFSQVFKSGPGDGHFHPLRVIPHSVDEAIDHRSRGCLFGIVMVVRRQYGTHIAGARRRT